MYRYVAPLSKRSDTVAVGLRSAAKAARCKGVDPLASTADRSAPFRIIVRQLQCVRSRLPSKERIGFGRLPRLKRLLVKSRREMICPCPYPAATKRGIRSAKSLGEVIVSLSNNSCTLSMFPSLAVSCRTIS